MQLVAATDAHLTALMDWFPDQRSCAFWASPEFRYPFTPATFRQDVRPELPSYSLIASDEGLLGFGQYYLRVGRCHLARLAISPDHRGQALGALLIREICRRGCSELGVTQSSLFVLVDNVPAFRLYSRIGFTETPYPGEAPKLAGCAYMVASPEAIRNWD